MPKWTWQYRPVKILGNKTYNKVIPGIHQTANTKLLCLLQLCILVSWKRPHSILWNCHFIFASENKPSFLFDGTQNNLWSCNLLLSSPKSIYSKVNLRDGCLGCYDVRGKVDKRPLEGIRDSLITFYKWFLPHLFLYRNVTRYIQ